MPREEPSPGWGVVLGDLVHNARSAWDNLVTALVLRNGQVPSRDNAFPVCLKPSDWRKRVTDRWPSGGQLAGVRREDVDLIESLQPYMGVDLSSDPEEAAESRSRLSRR